MGVEMKRSVLISDKLYRSQKSFYARAYSAPAKPPWDGVFNRDWLATQEKTIAETTQFKRALDIGTGLGFCANFLAGKGWRAVGIDYLLEPLLEASRATLEARHGNLKASRAQKWRFVNADFFEAPFADSSFGLIVDWGLFHHIRRRDTRLYLATIERLLRPSGSLLLGCFTPRFKETSDHRSKQNWKIHNGHYDRFSTLAELRAIFDVGAFRIVSAEERQRGLRLLRIDRR